MKLSIIIPVYNERTTIARVLHAVEQVFLEPLEKEIIIVDDGSTDGTGETLKPFQSKHRVILHERNRGKGAALQTGFAAMTGNLAVIQDADLEYDPQDLPSLLRPILEGKADVVYGSRFLGNQPHRVLYFWHSVANRLITTCSNIYTNLNLSDVYVGYKVFTREVIKTIRLREPRFGFEAEITAKIAKKNLRVYEVGISYSGRMYEEGKKVGFRDGLRAIWCIVKYRFFN